MTRLCAGYDEGVDKPGMTLVSAPAPLPFLSEWGMLLSLPALVAAFLLHRRQRQQASCFWVRPILGRSFQSSQLTSVQSR